VTSPGDGGRPPIGGSPWALLGLGTELATTLVLGVLVGYGIDRWLGTAPWFLVAGSVLGMTTALFNFFRKVLPKR
jgi:F0F1-type ATP synthase assembly protein I